MLRFLPLLLIATLLGCASEETYELATSGEDFVRLQIGEQEYLMNARPERTVTRFRSSNGWESLEVQRSTADHAHVIQLNLGDCSLKEAVLPKSFVTDAGTCGGSAQDVTIAYTTFNTNEAPGCPHLVGEPTQLAGTITITSWGADDLVIGSFESEVTDGDGHRLRGTFRVYAY
ncbi:hypothetical protein [Lewinella sp. IMCC34183]|uniref:hypothetical protein n=1 Tax=Lewinella sp. IMCC34183 TaxID=2248762 RepID=UPI000E2279D7|nr:hypothetical protein [Lewinella sp. IMCC34183]